MSKTYVKSSMVNTVSTTTDIVYDLSKFIDNSSSVSINQIAGVSGSGSNLTSSDKLKLATTYLTNHPGQIVTFHDNSNYGYMESVYKNNALITRFILYILSSDTLPSSNPLLDISWNNGDELKLINPSSFIGYIRVGNNWVKYGEVGYENKYYAKSDDPLVIQGAKVNLVPTTEVTKSITDSTTYSINFSKPTSTSNELSITNGTTKLLYQSSDTPDMLKSDVSITATKVYNAIYNDYAEYFEKGESTEPGDIISLDTDSDNESYVKATDTSEVIVGVHSDTYGHLIGGDNPPDGISYEDYNNHKYIPVALSGRVLVKVCGKVQKGDYIVPSKIPGIGKASKIITNSVGIALTSKSSDGFGKVKILVKLG